MRNIRVRVAVIAAAAAFMVGAGVPQTAQAATVPGTFVAVTPTRLLDTRSGTGAPKAKIGAGKALVLQVGGQAGVPTSGVSAVALNVNALNSTAGGRIIVYADGTTRPEMSSVNFVAGVPSTSLVVSRLSSAGKVALFNTSSQPVDLIADLSGYFVGGTVTIPGGFVAVPPSRSLDTRNAIGADRQDLFGDGTTPDPADFTWQVAGRNGVPTTGASAVVMSVTITNATVSDVMAPYPSQSWNLMGWPDDNPLSTLNGMSFVAGRPVTNLYVVPLGADGRVRMTEQPFAPEQGTFDVIADVVGYTRSGIVTTPGAYQVAPSRFLGFYTIAAGATVTTKAIADAGAVVPLNLTVRAGATAGALIAYEAGTARPTATRNINFLAGEKVSNAVLVKSSAAGAISLTNSSSSTIVVGADAAGYFRGAAPAANTLWTTGSNGFGLLAAGGAFSWGFDLVTPTQLSGVKRLYAGDHEHGIPVSYALMPNGTVRAWGSWGYRSNNLSGNPLGLQDITQTSVPTQIPQVSNVIDIAASNGGAFFLQGDGTVWGTGDGWEGQLLNTVPEESGVNSPIKLPGLTGITSIGRQFAAKADGSVVTWDRAGVRAVPGITDAVDLNDSYALRRNGTVARLTPTGAVPVNGLSNVIAINNRFALTSSGTVWVLPNATVTGLRQVDGLTNVTTLGSYGPIALKADGSVWIWRDGATATKVENVPPMSLAYKTDATTGSWENIFMVTR